MTYRVPVWQRVLCCLLFVCYLLCAICMPYAQAVATELVAAGTLTVIAAIWMASGAELPSGADIYKAAKQVYDQYIAKDPALREEAHALGQAYVVRNGTTMGASVLKCSQRLWQAICGGPAMDMVQGGYFTGPATAFEISSYNDYLARVFPYFYDDPEQRGFSQFAIKHDSQAFVMDGSVYTAVPMRTSSNNLYFVTYKNGAKVGQTGWSTSVELDSWCMSLSHYKGTLIMTVSCWLADGDTKDFGFPFSGANQYHGYLDGTYPKSISFSSYLIPCSAVTKPADDIAVKMPADIPTQQEDGTIVYPDLPTSAADYQYPVADIPLQEGATSVPEDVIIDASTGAAVDGSTDVPGNPDIPVNPDVSVDWPAPGTVTLPELIVSKFPFCIPFDLVKMVDTLCADPIAPSWTIHLDIGGKIGGDIELDLERFDSVIKICRWGLIAITVAGLAYATSRYIKW